MKSKLIKPNLKFLLVVILFAAGVWWLEKPTKEKTGDVLNQPLFETLDRRRVSRIEIESLSNELQLRKENGKWKVSANTPIAWYDADAKRIDLAFSLLLDTKKNSLVGQNKNRHGFFAVNQTGMQIRLFDESGTKMAHLFVGKAGPGFLDGYARLDSDNNVYLVNRMLRSDFPLEVNAWRNKVLWDTAVGNLKKIEINKKKIEKNNPLFQQLAKVEVEDFATESAEDQRTGLSSPSIQIKIITDTTVHTLFVGKKKRGTHQYYLQQEENPQVYLMNEDWVKKLWAR